MSSATPIKIELVSDPMYLCGAREFVSTIAHRVGFDDIACSKIALALDEALSNIIRHGYKRDETRPIWVTVVPTKPEGERPGAIEIIIEDEADQVDPDRISGRDLEDVRPGGLGVHIMREVMDAVEYTKRPTKGMRLRMHKVASDQAADGGEADGGEARAPDCRVRASKSSPATLGAQGRVS